jgi:hypothetical protein
MPKPYFRRAHLALVLEWFYPNHPMVLYRTILYFYPNHPMVLPEPCHLQARMQLPSCPKECASKP